MCLVCTRVTDTACLTLGSALLQELMGAVPLEIQQHCLEVKSCLRGKKHSGGDDLAVLLLGRALEVSFRQNILWNH